MISGPQPFAYNFGAAQQGQQQNPLAQILQMRQQQGAQQQMPMQDMQQPMQASQAAMPQGGGINDIAKFMGWNADPKASGIDNKLSAFKHVVSMLGFG